MKLLKLSATALIIAGANMLLSQSALACTQNDPHYHACVYHNIILPQQQQGYGNNGVYYEDTSNAMREYYDTISSLAYRKCQVNQEGHNICYVYNRANNELFSANATNQNGKELWMQTFKNNQVKLEVTYDNNGNKSTFKQYFDNGKIGIDGKFVNGLWEQRYYYETGILGKIEISDKDKLIQTIVFNEQGQKTRQVDWTTNRRGKLQVTQAIDFKDGKQIVYKPDRRGRIIIDGKVVFDN